MVTKLRQVSYAEVIGYWISYEFDDRPDFRNYVESHFPKDDIRFITEPHDYNDPMANSRRLAMLRSYRRFISWFRHAKWWVVSLSDDEISNLLVIHSPHWDLLSTGTVRTSDIAEGIREKRWRKKKLDANLILNEPAELDHIRSIARAESKKISKNLKKKVKSKSPSRIVVIGADGGKDLTVIDGVHRAVRLCLYKLEHEAADHKLLTQEAYLGLTPDPLQRTSKEWSNLHDFFDREQEAAPLVSKTF